MRPNLRKFATGDRWGDWFLNAELSLLEYRPGVAEYRDTEWTCRYYVPLRELRSWSGLNRWIEHLSAKNWASGKVLTDFRTAASEIFYPREHDSPGEPSKDYFERRFVILSEEEREARCEDDEFEEIRESELANGEPEPENENDDEVV